MIWFLVLSCQMKLNMCKPIKRQGMGQLRFLGTAYNVQRFFHCNNSLPLSKIPSLPPFQLSVTAGLLLFLNVHDFDPSPLMSTDDRISGGQVDGLQQPACAFLKDNVSLGPLILTRYCYGFNHGQKKKKKITDLAALVMTSRKPNVIVKVVPWIRITEASHLLDKLPGTNYYPTTNQ